MPSLDNHIDTLRRIDNLTQAQREIEPDLEEAKIAFGDTVTTVAANALLLIAQGRDPSLQTVTSEELRQSVIESLVALDSCVDDLIRSTMLSLSADAALIEQHTALGIGPTLDPNET